MRRLSVVFIPVFLSTLMAVAALPAQATTTQTGSCVDGGGVTWSAKASWGSPYRAGDGVTRVPMDYAGFTNVRNVPTDSSVRSYDASGRLLQTLTETGLWDYQGGAVYRVRNPLNPPSAPGQAKIVLSLGVDGDGYGRCSITFTQPGATPPAAARPVGPAPGPWTLTFSDEFNGSTVDTTKWRPNWLAGTDTAITKPINSAELSCYDPRNTQVTGGSLLLKAERRSCTADNGRTYAYASGMVQSNSDYRFAYGYAEARMYLPVDGKRSCGPNWAAFWINGQTHPEDGEIDVMECLSGDNVAWHYHWGTDANYRQNGSTPSGWNATMPSTPDGWHTFGVDWRPGRLDFYYDGRLVGSQTEGVTGTAHYLIVNLGISGSTVAVPQTAKVDYVRVWQHS